MELHIFLIGLFIVSTCTGFATQGVKAVLKEFKVNPYPNTLASVVSVILSVLLAVGYAIVCSIEIDKSYVAYTIALALCGWFAAMCGYDKVKQMFEQIAKGIGKK